MLATDSARSPPRPHRFHGVAGPRLIVSTHRKRESIIVGDDLTPISSCWAVPSSRVGGQAPHTPRLSVDSRWRCHYCLNTTVVSLGVVKVATSIATPTPRSLDTQLMLCTRYLTCRHATLRTTQLQCTRRAVIGINRPLESVQALMATCPLALLHGRQSFRCSSQIHTWGIDFGVRYQCCHGWTVWNSPHTAHFTTLTVHTSMIHTLDID